jgi:hypothetical protein
LIQRLAWDVHGLRRWSLVGGERATKCQDVVPDSVGGLVDIELVPLATIVATGRGIIPIGIGPAGDRMIGELSDFQMSGSRLNAHMKGNAAADWALVSPDSTLSVDVRLAVETDDGALIYVAYQGRADLSAGWDDATIYVAPRFETSDPRYKWLNSLQAVGKGWFAEPGVHYEWYAMR